MPRYIGNTEITSSYLGDALLTNRYLGDTDLGSPTVPLFTGIIPDLSVITGESMEPYSASIHFTTGLEPDVYSLQNAPTWMTIDSLTGLISGVGGTETVTPGITVTGTVNGNPTEAVSNTFSMTVGVVGNEGLRFNGIDSYAKATTNLTLTGDFDYEVKIKYLGPTSNNTQQHGVNGGNRCFFGIRNTNEFMFGHGSIWTDLGEYANFDQWYVFKISKVGSDYLCYIDDVLKHTAVGEATRTDFPVYIGCGSNATDETIPGLFNNAQIDYVDFVDLAGSNSIKWILDSGSIISEESDPAGNPAVYHNVVAGDWIPLPDPSTLRPVMPLQINPTNVLAQNLIAAYRATNDGTWTDATGNAANGVLTNVDNGYFGDEKYASSFNGTNSKVTVNSTIFNNDNLSISARIRTRTGSAGRVIMQGPSTYDYGNRLELVSEVGKLGINGTEGGASEGYAVNIKDQWKSFTAIHNTKDILIEGATYSDAVAASLGNASGLFTIGSRVDNSNAWTGDMKYAYFHSVKLSQSQADALAADPDQIFVREVGVEAPPTFDDAGIHSHGDPVAASLTGVYDRTLIDYDFAGGSNGFLEAMTPDAEQATVIGDNWKTGTATYYGSATTKQYAKTNAERNGTVLFCEIRPAADENPENDTANANGCIERQVNGVVGENVKLRFSYWYKREKQNVVSIYQHKQWRIKSTLDTGGFNPMFYAAEWYGASANEIPITPTDMRSTDPGGEAGAYWSNDVGCPDDTWFRWIIEIDTGTYNTEDSKIHIRKVVPGAGTTVVGSSSDVFGEFPDNVNMMKGSKTHHTLSIQNFIGNRATGEENQRLFSYIDDMVMQAGSWASVEIGDNASYNLCTHLEEQEVTSWTDNGSATSIGYVLNEGGLSAGNYYEHIRDDNGNLISTREIEIV